VNRAGELSRSATKEPLNQMVTHDRVLGLFKFGKRDHIEELVRGGLLFMNALSYFVKLENDELRSDRDEGLIHVIQATGATLSVEQGGQYIDVAKLTGLIRASNEEQSH
jgi:hypothetical protein